MAFMNLKTDVINIEITQYGKYLISEGKFKPEYYGFFDDHILYDSLYTNVSESQNNIHDRITTGSVNNTAQYVFSGIETEIKKINKLVRSGEEELGGERIQPHGDKNYSLISSIGNSSLSSQYFPSFNIKYLNGEISSSISYLSESHSILRIPQLSSSIRYTTYVDQKNNFSSFEIIKEFNDDSNIKLEKDYILLEISEDYTSFKKENFDIEIYLFENYTDNRIATGSSQYKTQLIPLYFSNKRNIEIIGKNEKEFKEKISKTNTNEVEYFLDIEIDSEIDDSFICKTLKKEQSKNIFSDKSKFDSKDKKISDITAKNIIDRSTDEFEDC